MVLNSGAEAVLLRNDAPKSHWIAFRLQGSRSNRDGYGAKVRVMATRDGETFSRVFECRSARSYASACDPRVRVGLGSRKVRVDRVDIHWPSGARQTLEAPGIDQVHEIMESGPRKAARYRLLGADWLADR